MSESIRDSTAPPETLAIDFHSPEHNADPVMQTREIMLMDEEVYKLRTQISAISTRRNHLSPIYRLPPEIIVRIFSELTRLCPPGYHSRRRTRLGWIAVTHVSRRWRDIALQHATLWTHVSANLGFRWMDEMLVRSKELPVKVTVSVNSASTISALRNHISRVEVCMLQMHDSTGLYDLLDQPMPLLRDCNVAIGGCSDFVLPPAFFVENAPRMERLDLQACILPWSTPGLADVAVVSLTLHEDCTFGERYTSSYRTRMLKALARMSTTESLSLITCLPINNNEAFPEPDSQLQVDVSADLRSLRTLNITDTTPEIATILPHLRLPPTCLLRLKCKIEEPVHMTQLSSVLPGFLSFVDIPFLRLALRSYTNDGDYELSLWASIHVGTAWDQPLFTSESIRLRGFKSESRPNVRVLAVNETGSEGEQDAVCAEATRFACAYLPLQKLRVLDVADELTKWTSEFWSRIFGSLEDLQHIRVTHGTVRSFTQSFCGDEDHSETNLPRFPHLKTLTIWNRPHGRPLKLKRILHALAYALEQRKYAQAEPLEGLYLQEFSPDAEEIVDVTGIKEFVPVVLG